MDVEERENYIRDFYIKVWM